MKKAVSTLQRLNYHSLLLKKSKFTKIEKKFPDSMKKLIKKRLGALPKIWVGSIPNSQLAKVPLIRSYSKK